MVWRCPMRYTIKFKLLSQIISMTTSSSPPTEEKQVIDNVVTNISNSLNLQSVFDSRSSFRKTMEGTLEPIFRVYNRIPGVLTQWKKPFIESVNPSGRLLLLSALTLGQAVLTFRYSRSYLVTIRNVVFGFYGMGLILAPEVYNPFMVK